MSDTNFWSEPRPLGLTPYGNNIGIDYGGTEQRIAWALDETMLAQSVIGSNKSKILFPLTQLSQSQSTGPLTTLYSNSIRVVILTTSDDRAEVSLEGSTEGTTWFSLTGGSIILIKEGSYTFCIKPLKSPKIRLNIISSSSPVGVEIIC